MDELASAELNALGVYLLSSLVFVVAALLEFAFVVLLNRKPRPVGNSLDDGNPGECVMNSGWGRGRKIASKESSTIKILEAINKQIHDKKYVKPMPNGPPAHVVDLISFCVYIFSFIVFNVIYWVCY